MTEVAILASGPSLCVEDVERVRQWRGPDRKVIAINNCYQLAPWADVVYACDLRWWDRYHADVTERCDAELWAHSKAAVDRFGLNRYRHKLTGGNGGYQALRLAVCDFGADRVILLGYDMKGSHWHGDHKGFPNPKPENFKQWCGWLQRFRKEFPDIEILNATRDTAVDAFPRVPLEDALKARERRSCA